MPNDYFKFKQFQVKQDRSVFKVGTDSVLLGAWADVSVTGTVLDIGTGTGLLVLMLAQRCRASITGIEIDEPSYRQAAENAALSPWSGRINIRHTSLQDYMLSADKTFDLIICNPPYFKDSMKSGNIAKDMARHDTGLSLEELINGVTTLMAPRGRFCLVLPSERYEDIIILCDHNELFLSRELAVKPTVSLPPGRHLLEFRRTGPGQIDRKEIAIERSARHDYTDDYREMTGEYYLAF